MFFQAVPMTFEHATAILKWTYLSPYDFYNMEVSDEAYAELLDGSYQAVVNQEQLVGFFCTGRSAQVPAGLQFGLYADDYLDIGLGRHPELTGQGTGFTFCSFVLDTAKSQTSLPLRLTVATFNERAIHLYEQLGFRQQSTFSTAHATFIVMTQFHA
ncbi:GNAT family N-acetyltransferase [Exiguobacterium antarcticum]|uniref:GNAT family N-acetyltransferase n=1 Tax=Exiguobacterium antarcticum TaxID=132920 RepID=A0ABT6R5X7_9BACL|nr:GNAT family N-acetyltransferase [Exiguobacterium antarcticum]AFS70478.1 Acetyltransferase, GNAT family domain protein [Exiguobacterium antarcticum B7]MDI3236360.1 GNAT family N-acetyltransferase [Exiguobacterium antarcticum]